MSQSTQEASTLSPPLVLDELEMRAVEALLAREIPWVLVPSFLRPEWCAEVASRFEEVMSTLPERRKVPLGPTIGDTLVEPVEMFIDTPHPEAYFAAAARDAHLVRDLFEGGEDPLRKMQEFWHSAGWRELPAEEGPGQCYLPDLIWAVHHGAVPPHVDRFEQERTNSLSRFPRRLNYNVFIQNPDKGGEFAVYGRFRGSESVPAGRKNYGFEPDLAEAIVEGCDRRVHHPAPGDLILFDALLYHEVLPVEGYERTRITVHSNILLNPPEKELLFFV